MKRASITLATAVFLTAAVINGLNFKMRHYPKLGGPNQAFESFAPPGQRVSSRSLGNVLI